MYQMTLKRCVGISGIGIHTGQKVRVNLKPADEDAGIIFLKKTPYGWKEFPFDVKNILDTNYATTIGFNGESISTVEHLVSALRGMGIDNTVVQVEGDEIPALDGSAAPFCQLIKEAGLTSQSVKKRYITLKRPIGVSDNDRNVILYPSDKFSISYTIFFEHPSIRIQSIEIAIDPGRFEKDISPARTFGFMKDVETLRSQGKALGGSMENAIVLNHEGVMNKEGLRFSDEFVRHKVLDAIGDLALFNSWLLCRMVAFKSGHELNYKLVKKLLYNHPDLIVEIEDFPQERKSSDPFPLLPFEDTIPVPRVY